MNTNRGSTISGFVSCVIYDLIGCSHPLMRYRQPLEAKTTATCSLPHPENERQWSINNCWSCLSGNQGIAQIFEYITELLTSLIGKITIYQRKNTDSKIIDIANFKTCKNKLLAVECMI